MSIKAEFKLTDALSTDFTMELTMTLSEWIYLRDTLTASDRAQSTPEWNLRHKIHELVTHAQKHFVAEPQEVEL